MANVTLNPYLLFNGQCEEAFQFYAKVLGGKIEGTFTYGASPMAGNMPKELHSKVMHTSMTVHGQSLMGSDPPPDRYSRPEGFSVALNLTDTAEAERIFRDLSAGGNITMPIQQTFWAARFGMFTDRYGIPWMINCSQPA